MSQLLPVNNSKTEKKSKFNDEFIKYKIMMKKV